MRLNGISVIVTLCNRFPWFKNSVESLGRLLSRDDELIVVDFRSDDGPVAHILERYCTRFPVKHLIRKRPFRNAFGLNIGAKSARTDVLFFSHAEMQYPKDFRERVFANVHDGQCCFPLFWWEKSQDGKVGKYSEAARGIAIFTRQDWFQHKMAWDESIDWRHGSEDTHLWEDSQKVGLTIVRPKFPGLRHKWHPGGQAAKMRFYPPPPPGRSRGEPRGG